jgi:hypothetical protein
LYRRGYDDFRISPAGSRYAMTGGPVLGRLVAVKAACADAFRAFHPFPDPDGDARPAARRRACPGRAG